MKKGDMRKSFSIASSPWQLANKIPLNRTKSSTNSPIRKHRTRKLLYGRNTAYTLLCDVIVNFLNWWYRSIYSNGRDNVVGFIHLSSRSYSLDTHFISSCYV